MTIRIQPLTLFLVFLKLDKVNRGKTSAVQKEPQWRSLK
ncbi:hypothetical protein THIOSC13_770004 [uncultured Thiomicrorhabdus sp.]